VVDRKNRNSSSLKRLELGLNSTITKDGNDRVNALVQQDIVVVCMDLIVTPAINCDDCPAKFLDSADSAVKRLTVPEVLRTDNSDAYRFALK
jgi:hypothetical protein